MNTEEQKIEQDQNESIADLEVKKDQAADTKAGTGAFSGGGMGAGKVHVHD